MAAYEDLPFAEWLEDTAHGIIAMEPDIIGMVAIREPDGIAMTSYFNADAGDLGRMISTIHADLVLKIIENNASLIRNMVMDQQNDEDGEEDDEDGGD